MRKFMTFKAVFNNVHNMHNLYYNNISNINVYNVIIMSVMISIIHNSSYFENSVYGC